MGKKEEMEPRTSQGVMKRETFPHPGNPLLWLGSQLGQIGRIREKGLVWLQRASLKAWRVIQATTGNAHRMEAASSVRAALSTRAQGEGRGPIVAASLRCPHSGCYSTATSSGNSQAQVGGMTAGQKSKVTPGDPTVAAGALRQQTHTGRSGGAVLGGQPS